MRRASSTHSRKKKRHVCWGGCQGPHVSTQIREYVNIWFWCISMVYMQLQIEISPERVWRVVLLSAKFVVHYIIGSGSYILDSGQCYYLVGEELSCALHFTFWGQQGLILLLVYLSVFIKVVNFRSGPQLLLRKERKKINKVGTWKKTKLIGNMTLGIKGKNSY